MDTMTVIENSVELQQMWDNYQKRFAYAKDISFDDVCDVIRNLIININ